VTHHPTRRCALLLAGLGLFVAPRGSASAQRAEPPAPDTIPVTSAGPPAYLRSLHTLAAPVLLGESPFRVLLAPAATAAALDAVVAPDSLARACQPPSSALAPPGYTPGGVAVDATKYFVIVAVGASTASGLCERRWNSSAAAIWSGLSFGGSAGARVQGPRALHLFANGVEVKPELSLARPSHELHGSQWQRASAQLRYYFPMSVLAASSSGARPALVVQVWDERGAPTSFALESDDAERMQYAHAVWRLATTAGTARPVRLTPRREVPGEYRALLALATVAPDSGALRAAELLSIAPTTRATSYERDVVALLVADVLAQRADSMAARGLISSVRSRRACLAAPEGLSPALAATIASGRQRCPEHSPLTALGAGIVVPGGGHYLHSSRLIAVVATAAISSVFVSAYSLDATAKRNYARYQSSRLASQATDLFELATTQRTTARARARVGLIVWGADAVLGAIITSAYNREVARGKL
jgi:hypothetical protein